MPYEVVKKSDGYKVCKKDDKTKCFSKKPLSKTTAEKQKIAIIISEKQRKK